MIVNLFYTFFQTFMVKKNIFAVQNDRNINILYNRICLLTFRISEFYFEIKVCATVSLTILRVWKFENIPLYIGLW